MNYKALDVLKKIYEDRKPMDIDEDGVLMSTYDFESEEEPIERLFNLNMKQIDELIPQEFAYVVGYDENGIIVYGDYEKIYETFISSRVSKMKSKTNIEVEGRTGKWYVIGKGTHKKKLYYILEHETYGDLADWILVDEYGTEVEDEEIKEQFLN